MRTAVRVMAAITAPATTLGEAAPVGMAAIQGGAELDGVGVARSDGDLVFGLGGRIGGGAIHTVMHTIPGGTHPIRTIIRTPACRVIRARMTTTATIPHQQTRKPVPTRTDFRIPEDRRPLRGPAMRIT